MLKSYIKSKLSKRNKILFKGLWYWIKRKRIFTFRIFKNPGPTIDKLHLGCGNRHVAGWFNVDLVGSEYNVDFISRKLPWKNSSFKSIISQHVVEHLYLDDELIPLFKEMYRVLKPDGELWISTPDMEKICKAYLKDKGNSLILDRKNRLPDWTIGNYPAQHILNDLFHQDGEHVNLFDFELLKWTLEKAGFTRIELSEEGTLLTNYPEFPPRRDDFQTLYVKAMK